MTIVLDATIGGPSANSYIDVATADGLLPILVTQARFNAWKALDSTAKETFLIRAVKMIETYMDFDGQRVDSEQPLDWPRFYVYGPDRIFPFFELTIPPQIQEAQALMGLNLAEGFDQSVAASSPIDLLKISSLTMRFVTDQAARGQLLLPAEVVEKFRGFGDYVGASGQARMVKLVRA